MLTLQEKKNSEKYKHNCKKIFNFWTFVYFQAQTYLLMQNEMFIKDFFPSYCIVLNFGVLPKNYFLRYVFFTIVV